MANQEPSGGTSANLDAESKEYYDDIIRILVQYPGLSEQEATSLVDNTDLFSFSDTLDRALFFHEEPWYYAMILLYRDHYHDRSGRTFWQVNPTLWPPPRDCYGPVPPFEGVIELVWASSFRPGNVECIVRRVRGRLELGPVRLRTSSGETRHAAYEGFPFYEGMPTYRYGSEELVLLSRISVREIAVGDVLVQAEEEKSNIGAKQMQPTFPD